MRSYVMIINACRQGLQKRGQAQASAKLQPGSEIKAAFATWHAAAKLAPGPESNLPVCVGIVELYGIFEFETTINTVEAAQKPFMQLKEKMRDVHTAWHLDDF